MSLELFNTSAPRGLHPGTSGFCTVAMTAGLPPALEQRLALLSGYRSLAADSDAGDARSPVAWSHFRLPLGGTILSVLSRVGDAGVDYSGRSNRFAHHLVLNRNEQPAPGPAWLLRQPGLMQSSWDGVPRLLEQARPIPNEPRPAQLCAEWEAATGDGGWAGVLAQHFLDHPHPVANLLFRPGLELLPLIDEAISLLPPARRWDVTFSTYFTDAPAGVSCAWRGCVLGSRSGSEAKHVGPGALLIDLTRPLGPAPDSSATRAARRGEMLSDPGVDAPVSTTHAMASGITRPIAAPMQPVHRARASGEAEKIEGAREDDTAAADEPVSGNAPPAPADARAGQWILVAVMLAAVAIVILLAVQQRKLQSQVLALTQANALLQSQIAATHPANADTIAPHLSTAVTQPISEDPTSKQVQIERFEIENRALRAQLNALANATQPTSEPAQQPSNDESAAIAQLRAQLATSESALASLRAEKSRAATEPASSNAAAPGDARTGSGADVLDDSLLLWRDDSGQNLADGIQLNRPASMPAGLSLIATSARMLVLRDVSTTDLAVITLQGGRVEFKWVNKRRFLEIPGASGWLSGSELMIRSGKTELAHQPLVAPAVIQFALSDGTTPLPATRGGWNGALALEVRSATAGWQVASAADGLTLTFKCDADASATFYVAIDRAAPIPCATSNWSVRDQSLSARPEARGLIESFPRAKLVLVEPRTRVVRCEIVIFTPGSTAAH